MRKYVLVFAVFLSVFLVGCNSFKPTSPTSIVDGASGTPIAGDDVLRNWSPYMLVHSTSEALHAYDQMFSEMGSKGRLRGVRIGLDNNYSGRAVFDMAKRYNLDILGVIDVNKYLNPNINPDIESVIEEIYRVYPDANYYQVGNEVTAGGNVNADGPITVEQYMDVFNRVRDYTRKNHPGKVLVCQSSFSGRAGAGVLEEMIERGLLKNSDRSNLVISMNLYKSQEASYYSDVIRREILGKFRVFVTESGVNDWDKQVDFVRNEYPRIQAQVGAERIYWYCAWCGDTQIHADFSLIRNVVNGGPLLGSPLYNVLTGKQGVQ